MKIGYDIEYALSVNGEFKPAGILPIQGVKGAPTKLVYGGVEIDCCAVEITPPPAEDEDSFVSNITNLFNEVKNKYQISLLAVPSVHFKEDDLVNSRSAMEMGCLPDYNAWTGKRNIRPQPQTTLRTFGGHIHIEGGTPNTILACDLVLGMWSVAKDSDKDRRKLYGKAGAFRKKPYGVEYRVLSNFWCAEPTLMREVYQLTRYAQTLTKKDIIDITEMFGGPDKIQSVINDNLLEDSEKIFTKVMSWK